LLLRRAREHRGEGWDRGEVLVERDYRKGNTEEVDWKEERKEEWTIRKEEERVQRAFFHSSVCDFRPSNL